MAGRPLRRNRMQTNPSQPSPGLRVELQRPGGSESVFLPAEVTTEPGHTEGSMGSMFGLREIPGVTTVHYGRLYNALKKVANQPGVVVKRIVAVDLRGGEHPVDLRGHEFFEDALAHVPVHWKNRGPSQSARSNPQGDKTLTEFQAAEEALAHVLNVSLPVLHTHIHKLAQNNFYDRERLHRELVAKTSALGDAPPGSLPPGTDYVKFVWEPYELILETYDFRLRKYDDLVDKMREFKKQGHELLKGLATLAASSAQSQQLPNEGWDL